MLCARSMVEWLKEQSMQMLAKFLRNESGATAIEYGLIAALISVAIIAGVSLTGTQLAKTFNDVGSTLQSANS